LKVHINYETIKPKTTSPQKLNQTPKEKLNVFWKKRRKE
jgi:hypothetical protein